MTRPETSASTQSAAGRERPHCERRVVRAEPARPNGETDAGLEAQMQRAWLNLFDAIEAAGYCKRDLVKTTVCVTEGGQLKLFRAVRDRMMCGHVVASAYLHVADLAAPAHLVEIEGELVRSVA